VNRENITNTTEAEMIGEAVFARITDLKYYDKIGTIYREMLVISADEFMFSSAPVSLFVC